VFSHALATLFPASCLGCGRIGTPLCVACAERSSGARTIACSGLRVRAAGRYAGTLRRAVLAYKRGRRDVGEVLAELLVGTIRPWAPPDAVLVPVPTIAPRRRERGFDQSARLARACGEALDLPVLLALAQISADAQRGRSRTQRLGARGRFACASPELVVGARIVLVDDVMTTGATLRDCAATLAACGARVEDACVVAYA